MSDEGCTHTETAIVDTRWVITLAGWLGVRRQRKCRACGARLDTMEVPCAEYFANGVEVPLTVFRKKKPRRQR